MDCSGISLTIKLPRPQPRSVSHLVSLLYLQGQKYTNNRQDAFPAHVCVGNYLRHSCPCQSRMASRARAGRQHGSPRATETDDGSPRPTVTCSPIQPPVHGKRIKFCHVRYHHKEWEDASDFVMDATQRCNNGGHVIFSPGITYTIGQALDLTFLKNIDIGMR